MSLEKVAKEKVLQVVRQLLASEEHLLEVNVYVEGEVLRRTLEIAGAIRDMRKELASKVLGMTEECWCIVKHLLLAEEHTVESLERFASIQASKGDVGGIALTLTEILKAIKVIREELISLFGGKGELEEKAS